MAIDFRFFTYFQFLSIAKFVCFVILDGLTGRNVIQILPAGRLQKRYYFTQANNDFAV